jgi:hypothetical protein
MSGATPLSAERRVCEVCQAECPVAANYCARCGRVLRGTMVRSATPISEVMKAWRTLSFSLTKREVRKLLGEPLRIEISGTLTESATETWTYEYEALGGGGERLSGRICISAGESRVIGWNEPDWGAVQGLDNART